LQYKEDNTVLNEGLNTPKEDLTMELKERCRHSVNENINYNFEKVQQQERSNDYEMSM